MVGGGPVIGRPHWRAGTQLPGTAQREDQFGVGEDEYTERNGNAESEVGPRIGATDARVVLQRPGMREVHATTAGDDAARLVAEEPRNVEEDTAERRGHQRHDGEGLADDLTSSQRVTDGDVAADGHRHRQPRTRQHQRVDHAVPVQLVHQSKVETVVRETAVTVSGCVEARRQGGETD